MNVLVAGGAGYIGHELLLRLSADFRINRIVVFDNLSRRNYNLFLDKRIGAGKIEFINGNILNAGKLVEALAGIDVVVHLAGLVENNFSRCNPGLFEQVNHWGTSELVSIASACNVKRFIYVSSDDVYGFSDKPLNNLATPNPANPYAISKLKGEMAVKMASDKLDTIILRCSGVYGNSPGARFDDIINRFVFEAKFMGRLQINDNPEQKRSFIHLRKVAATLHNLLFDEKIRTSDVYDLTDKVFSVREISTAITEIFPKVSVLFPPEEVPVSNRIILPDSRISHLCPSYDSTLTDEIHELSGHQIFVQGLVRTSSVL